jgi:glucose-1-phosphatase
MTQTAASPSYVFLLYSHNQDAELPKGTRASAKQTMAVDTILYDLGETLLHFDKTPIYVTLAERGGRSADEVEHTIDARYAEFSRGEVSGREWHAYLSDALGFEMPYDQFCTLWADIFEPFESMIDLARRLRPRFGSYILSNTDEIHIPWCIEKYALSDMVDGMILSYETGAVKPDPRIFDEGMRRFSLTPANCVFIDDLQENIDGAEAFGIRGILCRSAEQVARDLATLGVRA